MIGTTPALPSHSLCISCMSVMPVPGQYRPAFKRGFAGSGLSLFCKMALIYNKKFREFSNPPSTIYAHSASQSFLMIVENSHSSSSGLSSPGRAINLIPAAPNRAAYCSMPYFQYPVPPKIRAITIFDFEAQASICKSTDIGCDKCVKFASRKLVFEFKSV